VGADIVIKTPVFLVLPNIIHILAFTEERKSIVSSKKEERSIYTLTLKSLSRAKLIE
jgi:hypothetical protein